MPPARKKAPARNPVKPRVNNTRDRIVAQAIALFNRYGILNVAIDHIASELKISPGNLTYHFKRKDDLIRATLEVLKDNLRIALERPVSAVNPGGGAEYLIRMYRTLWNFRFFFNSLAHLLQDDPQLRKDYAEFSNWVVDTMVQDLNFLQELGHFQAPIAPNNFRLLSENIWAHILNWLRMQQIESAAASTPSNAAIYDAVLHLWSLCHHWLNPTFAPALLRVFQELLVPKMLEQKPVKARRTGKANVPT